VTKPSGMLMNQLVHGCLGTSDAACDYAQQRCADAGACGECLSSMYNSGNALAVAESLLSPSCSAAVNASDFPGTLYMVDFTCSEVGSCLSAVTQLLHYHGDDAFACINGSVPANVPDFCSSGAYLQFGIDSVCAPCPASVHAINVIVLATSTIGGASAVLCLAVVATIMAHERDRVSMRDRIVVGLMMANTVYSTANAIPLQSLLTGISTCGQLALSIDMIRFGRAWWFCGKYVASMILC
jgi:hypothetical protein